MIKNLICIGCPLGCPLTAEMQDGKVLSVRGNTCPRGKKYAEKELTNPERTVTSSVKVIGGEMGAVSVRTAGDIPKSKMTDCIKELSKITLTAPVHSGETVIRNVCGTGVSVIATKTVAKL